MSTPRQVAKARKQKHEDLKKDVVSAAMRWYSDPFSKMDAASEFLTAACKALDQFERSEL